LKDLKLGGNLLYGPLDASLPALTSLEILDLHGNNISSLPSNFGALSRLRILNISENAFEILPFTILASLPLTELVARKNQLRGALIEDPVDSFATLQSLDVSANQLTHITAEGRAIAFPSLHQLCVSMNRLQVLPDISSWTSLITLSADENSINTIPDGFIQLDNLRSVDFSSNDIRVIPAEIGRMGNLTMLQLSANSLRDKKFSSVSTEELKQLLVARLEPAQAETALDGPSSPGTDETVIPWNGANEDQHQDDHYDSRSELDDFATPPTSAPHSPARSRSHTASIQTWPIKSGGVLDRSNTQLSALRPEICSKVAATTTIREAQLHHNLFTALPDSLSFFAESLTCLSLAHNQLAGETYLGGASGDDNLELPVLKELNLSSNHITGLMPLVAHLRAPLLEKLDVSLNRISALPQGTQLRDAFPNLTVLFASNNHLVSLDPESIRGMRIVNAANNDVAHLDPRIGLLGGAGGLEKLDVSGNRFRVPRWNVLELGTEATLRWLRARVPVAELGAWRGANGQAGGKDDDEGAVD
jgi:Leucine-rich repeat (LRR) protein